jgi:hypothetical protein
MLFTTYLIRASSDTHSYVMIRHEWSWYRPPCLIQARQLDRRQSWDILPPFIAAVVLHLTGGTGDSCWAILHAVKTALFGDNLGTDFLCPPEEWEGQCTVPGSGICFPSFFSLNSVARPPTAVPYFLLECSRIKTTKLSKVQVQTQQCLSTFLLILPSLHAYMCM